MSRSRRIPAALPVLSTDREGLELLELGVADADAYYELVRASRVHLAAFGNYDEEIAATREEVRAYFAAPDDENLRFGLRLGGELIGRFDLNPVRPPHYVVGFWLGAHATGKGYATAAGAAVVDFARRELGATDLFGGVTHGNDRSVAVLVRLGFRAVAEFEDYTRYQLVLAEAPTA
ncbi:GNAT family N-acetyltransferase [Longispora sp. NPDC051575]|uniref:GNAT family N-acetyltransferase n=1 Tax=Longispora sp. NPDC051575 TaxID=3154943 RepID=UPI00342E1E58